MSLKSPLGFGMMRLPVKDGAPTNFDYEKIFEMVDAFIRAGYTYFDTSYVYHNGKSEEATRKAVVERYPRDAFTLATKFPTFNLKNEEEIEPIFQSQLEHLGAEYIDYYLLHNIQTVYYDGVDGQGGIVKTCQLFDHAKKWVEEGKVRHLGISLHSSAKLLDRILTEHPEIEFVQIALNYIDWESEFVQARACYETIRKHGKKVVIMEPVKGGGLAVVPSAVEQALKAINPDATVASWAMRFAGSLDDAITRLAEKSGETVDWLVEQGADLALNPSLEYQVKIEATDTFTTIVVIEALKKSLEASGATLYMNIRATELVTDDDGNVTGVVAVDAEGREVTFTGKAVVLATGGFGKDHERVEALRPDYKYVTTDEIAPTTGDGIDMAVAVGAQTVDLEQLMAHPSVGVGIGMVAGNVAPGGRNIQAIIVNLNGERFFSESLYGGTPYVLEQPEGTAIMVFTEEYLNDFLRGYYNLGAVKRGETAAELAVELGIDPDALQATVDKWNEDVANGVDTVFGRESNLNPLEGPLYAYLYNPGIHYCMGGILINEDAQVLNTEDAPIAGLYAGGEVTGGIHGTTRVDGSALTDTFTFGRIAGQNAADYALG